MFVPVLSGCFGGSDDALDPSAADDAAEMPTLPEGLEMEGADVLEYNETSVTWRWQATAPPGTWRAEPTTPPGLATQVDIPAGLFLQVSAHLTWSDVSADLDLYLTEDPRSYRCNGGDGTWVRGDDGTETCDITIRDPSPEPRRWTVHVASFYSPPGGTPFTLELTQSVLVDATPVGRAAGLPPGCDPARVAATHRAGGVVNVSDDEIPPVGCLVRTGTNSWEPSLGVTSDGTWFYGPSRTHGTWGLTRSTDGGSTWEHIVPAVAGVPWHVSSLDPFLHVDPDTGRVFLDDLLTPQCSKLSWSDDAGTTWGHSIAGCTINDHQKIVTGPPRVSTTVGYPNVVYRCAHAFGEPLTLGNFGNACQRSLDGGLTWQAPGTPPFGSEPEGGGGLGELAADDEGRLYFARGLLGDPVLAVSEDEGLTWGGGPVADMGVVAGDNDAAVTVDDAGNVYVAWVAEDGLVRLVGSRDHGLTWSDPVDATMPGVQETTAVHLAGGAAGRVAVAYLGTTVAATSDSELRPWNGYLGLTVDALDPDPTFHSVSVNRPDDPLVRGDCGPGRCGRLGDFIDVEIEPIGTPLASFTDTCTGDCATGDGPGPVTGVYAGVVGRMWGGPNLLGGGDRS